MTLVGGILAALAAAGLFVGFVLGVIGTFGFGAIFCVCLVLPAYQLTAGILCIVQGIKLMGETPEHFYAKTKTTAILQIICIISGDFINLILDIINLVFFNDEDIKACIRSKGGHV